MGNGQQWGLYGEDLALWDMLVEATVNILLALGVNVDMEDCLVANLSAATDAPPGAWHFNKTPESDAILKNEFRVNKRLLGMAIAPQSKEHMQ